MPFSPRMALFGAARGSSRFPGDTRDCGAKPRRDRQGDHPVTQPRQSNWAAGSSMPRWHPQAGSSTALAATGELGGWAPPSPGQVAEEDVSERWSCPVFEHVEQPGVPRQGRGEGGLRATVVPGGSEALLGPMNPRLCPLATLQGSTAIPPAGRRATSEHRPRRGSKMGMETTDGQTDRAVDGDRAAEWLLLLGFWVSS